MQPPLLFLSPLHKASRQIAVCLEGRCQELGVTTSEGHLLTYLARYAPCPVGELRRVFGLKGSTLTSMLDRLERDGRVRRAPNPEDRRSFLLEIEPPGRRIAATLRQEIERLEAAIRDEIDDRDLEGFSAVMRAIEEITRVHLRQETRR